jgi:CheY-like chemotaxis protein
MAKILVVDDQPDVRATLSGILTDAGHTVHAAANEGEALAAVAQEAFGFALLDVRLHGGEEEDESGLSLAMALRMLKPEVRIVMLTRYPRSQQIVRAIRYLGVMDFIDKKDQSWGEHILKTIADAQQEVANPSFKQTDDFTVLSISLAKDQPLFVRARGHHVSSLRTTGNLQIDLESYSRQANIAERASENYRFHVSNAGLGLWRDIFENHPEADRVYLEAHARSRSLSLLFEAPREFLRLPLEFIRSKDPAEYLILQHPLARFVCGATPKREVLSPQWFALRDKLRVLIIASNTEPPISGVDDEVRQLYDYFTHQDRMPANVTLIPTKSATYLRVRQELKEGKYDIVHYAGHGLYMPKSPEESSLYFWTEENRQGEVVPMKASELKMLLERSEARLVHLNSCYGTATGGQAVLLDDDFLGLADAVVQAGVPSVLGYRWPVSDNGACKMALAFYQSLLNQGSPEIALWSARCELAALDRNDPTWLSPILICQE